MTDEELDIGEALVEAITILEDGEEPQGALDKLKEIAEVLADEEPVDVLDPEDLVPRPEDTALGQAYDFLERLHEERMRSPAPDDRAVEIAGYRALGQLELLRTGFFMHLDDTTGRMTLGMPLDFLGDLPPFELMAKAAEQGKKLAEEHVAEQEAERKAKQEAKEQEAAEAEPEPEDDEADPEA